ncbi:uncharacterized protein [Typha angustifolia]|uniref:uncharacterized protein n=1 Tax=Typha angustifolia TaxID=59011 RepID=UPI003C2B9139
MDRYLSPHARFFSDLEQVESRLESEKPPTKSNQSSSPSPSSPIFLDYPNPDSAGTQESSGPALDFFSAAQEEQGEEGNEDGEEEEIEKLMSLLGLTMEESCGGCSFDDGFYSKVVGLKGPKCEEERRRLDGWIGYYYRHGRREPARLAHLLLGKASSCCFEEDEEVGFPVTVEEFLEHDPPPMDNQE